MDSGTQEITDMSMLRCQHCHREVTGLACRGLCARCYNASAIRNLYPPVRARYVPRHEPTEEELLACIAEQLPTMPGRRHGEE